MDDEDGDLERQRSRSRTRRDGTGAIKRAEIQRAGPGIMREKR